MATVNLQIPDISASQFQKEVIANDAHARLDKKVTQQLSKSFAAGDVTLTDDEHNQNLYIKCTGALAANRNLIVKNRAAPFIVEHAGTGGFTITVKTAAGTGVTIYEKQFVLVYCDGTNVVEKKIAENGRTIFLPGGQNNIDASTTKYFGPSGGDLIESRVQIPVPRGGVVSNLYLRSIDQPATGTLVCTIRKNGVGQSLTVTMPAGSTNTVVSDLVNSFAVAPGDLLSAECVNNATALAFFSGIAILLR